MHKGLLFASTILFAAPALAQQAEQPPLTDAERAQAVQELQDLRARMERLETRLGVPHEPPPPAAAPQFAAAPGPKNKDHNLELYGFVQLDAIQDFKRVNPDWDAALRPSRIPTQEGEFGSDGQSIFSIRQTRLGVKANGMLEDKPYEAKFEFDLFGTNENAGKVHMRIRHMYASWGPFLAGQTNTLFMDGDIAPNSIEYWGPPGMAWLRNPQIRYTYSSGPWTAAIALEHPSDDIDPGNIRLIDENVASNIQSDEQLPDLTAAVRYGGDWGHVRLAGILRKIGYETRNTVDNEPHGSETGWGLDLTGAAKLGMATPRLGIVYGRGIATYLNDGGMDLAPAVATVPSQPPNPPGFLLVPRAEAVKILGVSAFLDLQWAPEWSSSLGYSFTKVDNTNFQDPTAFHKGEYALANVLWTPADRVLTGLELQWGKRTDNDGDTGNDLRAQYSFKWSFSSKNIWDIVD